MPTPLLTTFYRGFIVLALIAVLAGAARPAAAEHLAASVTYIVDSNADSVSSGAPDGICDDGSGRCTLREAIKEANNTPGGVATSINFINKSTIINLTLGALVISGSNITITTNNPLAIDGSGNLAGSDNIDFQGNNNNLYNSYGGYNLIIRNARRNGIQIGDPGVGGYGVNNTVDGVVVTGSQGSGISLHDATGASIFNSLVGMTSQDDTACAAGMGNQGDGITINGASSNNVLVGNRIVCNTGNGISLSGSSTNHTRMINNYIGFTYGATDNGYAMANGQSGISDTSADYTQITNNFISGNAWYGIWLQGSTDATINNNFIGFALYGAGVIPNGYDGIRLSDGAAYNRVGGDTQFYASNMISGNDGCGVTLTSLAHDNLISGNYIGNSNGVIAVPNALAGVSITGGANHNDIGTDISGAPIQYISGNKGEGIYIEHSDHNSVHASNYVGLGGYPGSLLRFGNGREGIRLVEASYTTIEGSYAYNGGAGIAIEGSTSSNDMILPALDFGNGGLAVDLGNDGFTPNGAHTPPGPNGWLAYPQVNGTDQKGLTTGTACNYCTVYVYKAIGNPAAPGGGGQVLQYSESADHNGNWMAYPPPVYRSSDISTIACTNDIAGSCSEMSPRPTFYIPFIRKPVP